MNLLKLHVPKLISLLTLLTLLISACSLSPATTEPAKRFTPFPEEIAMLALTNAARAQAQTCGNQQFQAVPAVTWVETILDTAYFHSVNMGQADSEAHQGEST